MKTLWVLYIMPEWNWHSLPLCVASLAAIGQVGSWALLNSEGANDVGGAQSLQNENITMATSRLWKTHRYCWRVFTSIE